MVKQLKKIAAIGLSVITAATATLGLSLSASAEDSAETLKTVFDYSSLTQGGAAPGITAKVGSNWDSNGNEWGGKATAQVSSADGYAKLTSKISDDYYSWGYADDGWQDNRCSIFYSIPMRGGELDSEGIAFDYKLSNNLNLYYRAYARGKLFCSGASSIYVPTTVATDERIRKILPFSSFKYDGVSMTSADAEAIEYVQICCIAPKNQTVLSLYGIYAVNPITRINHAMLDYSDLSAGMSVKGITAKTHRGWNGAEVGDFEQHVSRSVTGSDGGVMLKCKTTDQAYEWGFGLTGWQTVKPALCFTLPLSSEQLSGTGIVLDYKAISSCRTFYSVTSGGNLFFVDGVGETNNSNIPVIAANTEGLRELRYSSFKRADGTYITEEEIQNISSFRICFNPTEWETSYLLKGVYVIDSPEKNHTYTAETESDKRGSVTGGGTFEYNTEVTLTAVPEKNFAFVGWYRGNQATPVSSDASYTFTALPELADKVYTAKFISVLKGDANDDGAMDILDLVRLKNYLADSENTEINENTANIVADEAIDSNDLALLRRWLIAAD